MFSPSCSDSDLASEKFCNNLLITSLHVGLSPFIYIMGMTEKLILIKCHLGHTASLFLRFSLYLPGWGTVWGKTVHFSSSFFWLFLPQFIEKHTLHPRLLAEIQKTWNPNFKSSHHGKFLFSSCIAPACRNILFSQTYHSVSGMGENILTRA